MQMSESICSSLFTLDSAHEKFDVWTRYNCHYNKLNINHQYYNSQLQQKFNWFFRFIDAYIKYPGKVHDTRVLVNSAIYQNAQSGNPIPNVRLVNMYLLKISLGNIVLTVLVLHSMWIDWKLYIRTTITRHLF